MVAAAVGVSGIAAGSIFTFSLSLGDYIAVTIVAARTSLLGNIIYGQLVTANNQPLAAALFDHPLRRSCCTCSQCGARARWRTSDAVHRRSPLGSGLDGAGAGVPLRANCFSSSSTPSNASRRSPSPRPVSPWTAWADAAGSSGMWTFHWANSAGGRARATAIALVLGTMAAFAVQRYEFFGRKHHQLPGGAAITLAGIVTGYRAQTRRSPCGGGLALHTLGLATVSIDATFCIVIVFNNTQARLRQAGYRPRRTPPPTGRLVVARRSLHNRFR